MRYLVIASIALNAFILATNAYSQVRSINEAKGVKKNTSTKGCERDLKQYSLLQGTWAQSIDSAALFMIKKNKIYYFDGANARSADIRVCNDRIVTRFNVNIVVTDLILKLTLDSLIFRDEEEKISRFVKVK